MMHAFAYKSVKTVEQAVGALADRWGAAEVLAGGTDLLALMKEGVATPTTVVNIKEVAELHGIKVADDAIRIGAAATLAEIAEHAAVKKHLPALAEAADAIAGPQIRNAGTLGGNLCQRTRDWYFRNGLSPEIKAENQYGAIFGDSATAYVHPSTLAPPLIAYGATVEVVGPNGKRTLAVEKLFQVSDLKTNRETVLRPNELITAVSVPVVGGTKSTNYEVRERQSHDWPLVQVSVALQFEGDKVKKASIVLGHVGPVPVRAATAEAEVAGKALDDAVATAAGRAAVDGATTRGKVGYKVTLTQVAVKRALLAAVGNRYWRTKS